MAGAAAAVAVNPTAGGWMPAGRSMAPSQQPGNSLLDHYLSSNEQIRSPAGPPNTSWGQREPRCFFFPGQSPATGRGSRMRKHVCGFVASDTGRLSRLADFWRWTRDDITPRSLRRLPTGSVVFWRCHNSLNHSLGIRVIADPL